MRTLRTLAIRTFLLGIPMTILILGTFAYFRRLEHFGTQVRPAVPVTHITEDDPRWDCRRMGNHVCGPFYMPNAPEIQANIANARNWLNETCPKGGFAWAESNPTQPDGYEVLGDCL